MAHARSLIKVAAMTAVAMGLTGVAPAAGAPSPKPALSDSGVSAPPPEVPSARPGGTRQADKVTLITGDTVWLTRTQDAEGRRFVSARIEPAPRPGGEEVSFSQWGSASRYYVVPSDAAPLVGSRLDERLFDVAGLIDSGASATANTRVLVTFMGSASRNARSLAASAGELASAAKLPGPRVLTSADAMALSIPAGKGRGLLAELSGTSAPAAFVSLDARVRAMDTKSMPQIGAPSAWKSGYTGKGVKVAVLDSGIDASHPDLVGQVAASKKFSDSDTTSDRVGHGTHIASIIAGTGKANPGMRGVAYQAKLLNGKVLDDELEGYESDIIAGMEWAAKSGADVINMSLGRGPGNGISPMETSLNSLSKKYGALFVVAAGNAGEAATSGVTAPSTADAAMSVAAVDSRNKVADFSESGPRERDSALKPDIAAPGVGILGAQSTTPVVKKSGARSGKPGGGSSRYERMSGTSMASPHVAGAAAVLAQARPELASYQLKSVLMGSARAGSDPEWRVGAGVVNIPAALRMRVIAEEASLSYKLFAFPQARLKPRTKTIHYSNTGRTSVVLHLRSSVTGEDGRLARGVSLSRATVRVPARGSASVQVTVAPGANPPGLYAGAITATPRSGQPIRTIVGWQNDVAKFKVTVKAVDRRGKPTSVIGMPIFDVRDQHKVRRDRSFVGSTTFRLPAGTYFAGAILGPAPGTGARFKEEVIAVEPEFSVRGDRTIVLDARKGRRMSVATPKPSTKTIEKLIYTRWPVAGSEGFAFAAGGSAAKYPAYAVPTKATTIGRSSLLEHAQLMGPGRDPSYAYQVAYLTNGRIPSSMVHTVKRNQVGTLVTTYRSPTPGALGGVFWVAHFPGGNYSEPFGLKFRRPNTITTYFAGDRARWEQTAFGPVRGDVLGDWWEDSATQRFAPGTTTRRDYFTPIFSPGAVTAGSAYRNEEGDLELGLPLFEDAGGAAADNDGKTPTSLTAYVDGKKVDSDTSAGLLVPAGKGKSLRMVQRVNRRTGWWKTSTATTGEWTAPIPRSNRRILPLMNVQYKLAGQSVTGDVPPGQQSVGLRVSKQTNPKSVRGSLITAKSLTLQWSIDGGKTWKPAKVTRDGTRATATFTPPATKPGASATVSLRAFASDGKGSSVRETVISAYVVAGLAPDNIARGR